MFIENENELLTQLSLAGFSEEIASQAIALALHACEAARIELLLTIDDCKDQKTRILAKVLSTSLMQSWCEDKAKLIPLAINALSEGN